MSFSGKKIGDHSSHELEKLGHYNTGLFNHASNDTSLPTSRSMAQQALLNFVAYMIWVKRQKRVHQIISLDDDNAVLKP